MTAIAEKRAAYLASRTQLYEFLKSSDQPAAEALLKDKVNYQVMGANVWKHAPSIPAMSDLKLRYYLIALRVDSSYRLSARNPETSTTVAQAVAGRPVAA